MPTDPRAPGLWSLPAWLGGPTAGLGALATAGLGAFLGLSWTLENRAAGVAARAASRPDSGPPMPLDPSASPDTRWWRSTPAHQVAWALAIERSAEARDRAEEVIGLLDAASRAAPLATGPRIALGVPSVGPSRDTAGLLATARALRRSGKAELALLACRRAIEIALASGPEALDPPEFDDDPTVRRFRLPHEASLAPVIRELVGASGRRLDEVSGAIPRSSVAWVAAGRLLREAGSPDSDRAFSVALEAEAPAFGSFAAAEHDAARGEALALLGRKADAVGPYRLAIDAVPEPTTRRRWRLALAQVLATSGQLTERAELIEMAKGSDPTDEIARRAADLERAGVPR